LPKEAFVVGRLGVYMGDVALTVACCPGMEAWK
jgi:hypothetical protein